MTAPQPPVVLAELEQAGRTVRVRCPFCHGPRGGARFHVHGLGADRDSYGPRLSHCVTPHTPQVYVLVPAPVEDA